MEERYLDLLKKCLTRSAFEEFELVPLPLGADGHLDVESAGRLISEGVQLVRTRRPDPLLREFGRDRPLQAETMIGVRRLDNIQECVRDVLERKVPGDLLEAGVWRGGAAIFMRAVLAAYGDDERTVWVADSFAGVPPPDAARFPADAGLDLHLETDLAVDSETVKHNFLRYDLLDPRVRFLHGFFADSLPAAPIERLALLRIDGDLYQSTWEALTSLYPKVSAGGWVIVDDYGAIPACRQATDDFRAAHGVGEPVVSVDWTAVCWKKA